MLERLQLTNVGPAPAMTMELAPRLNLVTGDNGLGKSFLLEVAWWALTGTWARHPVLPEAPNPVVPDARTRSAEIAFSRSQGKPGRLRRSKFDPVAERWTPEVRTNPVQGVVLYAQPDGGFAVWDSTRNHSDDPRPGAYLFSPDDVWRGNHACEGLIRDWASWQREQSEAFEVLRRVLGKLSPSPEEPLEPGELRKVWIDDPKRYPTLRMPYGVDVPVIHASAGMRRVIALAYLLVWAWREHLENSDLVGRPPAREIVFLIDEVEAHLHPAWQRRIIPALLDVTEALTGRHDLPVQLVASTHSPLALASVEPLFDPDRDRWFDLDLKDGEVVLRARPFVSRGDVGSWLTSEAFGLESARSLDGEAAIQTAKALLREPAPDPVSIREADAKLRQARLPDLDPFWVRWGKFVEDHPLADSTVKKARTPRPAARR